MFVQAAEMHSSTGGLVTPARLLRFQVPVARNIFVVVDSIRAKRKQTSKQLVLLMKKFRIFASVLGSADPGCPNWSDAGTGWKFRV